MDGSINEMSEKENSNFVTEKALAFAKPKDKREEQKEAAKKVVDAFKGKGPQVGE